MATVSDIATLALKHLGVIGAGETASADDSTEAQNAYARFYAEIQEDAFNTWPSDTIPAYLEDAVKLCVASRVRPIFYATDPAIHEAEVKTADRMLKALLRRKATQAPTQMSDF